jgi:thiamine biosynthesis protein ThiS
MTKSETGQIEISVNGVARAVPGRANLLEVLLFLEVDPEKVAVEKDRAIVRKPDWTRTPVESGSELEIVQFVGGG